MSYQLLHRCQIEYFNTSILKALCAMNTSLCRVIGIQHVYTCSKYQMSYLRKEKIPAVKIRTKTIYLNILSLVE